MKFFRFLKKRFQQRPLERKSKPRAYRTPLAVEILESRIVLSAEKPAILLLDPLGAGALSVTQNGSVVVTGPAPIVIDSTNAAAATASGNAHVAAQQFDVSGMPGIVATGSAKFQGTILSGQARSADPLASLAAPSVPTTTFAAVNYSANNPLTLSPGAYTGGIKLSGNGAVTLLPGLYYLQGGGFSDSGNVKVTGSGVTIYNAPRTTSDAISLSGNGPVQLTAPTSGAYQGIALYQDRNSTAPISITGNGAVKIEGKIYAAKAAIDLMANGHLNEQSDSVGLLAAQLIAADLSVTSNGALQLDAEYAEPADADALLVACARTDDERDPGDPVRAKHSGRHDGSRGGRKFRCQRRWPL